jgi:hypothetical protein
MVSSLAKAAVHVTAALTAVLALSACDATASSSGTTNAASAPTPTAVSSSTAASAGTTTSGDTTSSAGTTPSAGGSSGDASGHDSSSSSGCLNPTVSADIKSAVAQTWRQSKTPPLSDAVVPRPGSFYYGRCDGVQYAMADFTAGNGATVNDQTFLQDEGSGHQYFKFTSATGWTFVTADPFPPTGGCASVIPSALAQLWDNCAYSK